MKQLQAKNPEKYQRHFSRYIAAGKGPEEIEKMWTAVHAAIRANPAHVKVVRKTQPRKVDINKRKTNNKERKNRIKQRIAAAAKPKTV